MKKHISLLLALIVILALAACGKAPVIVDEPSEEPAAAEESVAEETVQEPAYAVTEYASLKELNEAAGVSLTHPGVMGVSDETFRTIDNGSFLIAEYAYTVNSTPYILQTAATTEDICAVTGDSPFADMEADVTYTATETMKYARWFNTEGQFVLSAADNGEMDEETFLSIAAEVESLSIPGADATAPADIYASLAGSWADTVSERAVMQIEAFDDHVAITVNWADSASMDNVWAMTATIAEDGLLSYTDCRCAAVEYPEGADPVETQQYAGMPGSFSFDAEGHICWTGAVEENCRLCVFEKLPD